jgi:bacterioferritin (cytochrome b1)
VGRNFPARVLEELWHHILAKRQEARERKRAEHADKIRQALMVLEGLRNWNLENCKS